MTEPTPPHNASPVSIWRSLAFIVGLIVSVVILLSVPQETARFLFFCILIFSILWMPRRRFFDFTHKQIISIYHTLRDYRKAYQPPKHFLHFSHIPRIQVIAEFAIIVALALSVTSHYLPYDPTTKIPGIEMEWITGSAHVAHVSLQEYGYLPLWNPYYRYGEPLIGNAVSFILNPFSSVPILLVGAEQGTKWAVALGVVIAGIGGWVLARVLGMGVIGRLLLAALLIGKGNMHTNITAGYFQLGLQQIYFPYIIAGAIAVMRGAQRWSIVLTGIMTALLFMAGNVWYILPMLISMGMIAIGHTVGVPHNCLFNWRGWGGMILAGVITLGVSAPYTLPVMTHLDHIGNHNDECQAGWEVQDLARVPALYTVSDIDFASVDLFILAPCFNQIRSSGAHFHYSFVMPHWIVFIIFILLPPIVPFLHRPALAHEWRLWLIGLWLLILMTMWGIGGTALWEFLYAEIELLRGWRFVGRALAVASFWVAILIALRIDGLSRALQAYRGRWKWGALALLSLTLMIGVNEPLQQWSRHLTPVESHLGNCLTDWNQQYQDDEAMFKIGYNIMWTLIDNDMQLHNIEADFLPLPDDVTIGASQLWLNWEMPAYAYPTTPEIERTLGTWGYNLLDDVLSDDETCLYYDNSDSVPYAFTAPLNSYREVVAWSSLYREVTTLTHYERLPDTIYVLAPPHDVETVLTVRELAYPGWEVWVNDEKVDLEIVGGLVSVELPPSDTPSAVTFAFRPPLHMQGSAITIITAVLASIFLLWRRKPNSDDVTRI